MSHVDADGLTYALDADPILLGAPIATNCKRLICPSCGPRRRAEILKHIRAGFHADEPLRFLTFTYPWETGYESTAEGVAAANRDFRVVLVGPVAAHNAGSRTGISADLFGWRSALCAVRPTAPGKGEIPAPVLGRVGFSVFR